MPSCVVIAISGNTDLLYGIRALELLAETECESHLILSETARETLTEREQVTRTEQLATHVYPNGNIGAPPASGSFENEGILITPCSSRTMANVAHGESGTLITRSADVALKERRTLVVMPNECPFSRIHIKNMLEVTDAGGIVVPPFPSFYQQPKTVDEIITRTVARALTFFNVDIEFEEWKGIGKSL